MKKILHMEYPFITSYPTHANLFACQQFDMMSLEWYFENYMNLFTDKLVSDDNSYVDFFAPVPWRANPTLSYQSIGRELLGAIGVDIISFLIEALDQNNYIFLYLNHRYISKSLINNAHDVFIYGFDKQNKIFHAADFFTEKYGFATCSFEEIKIAFQEVEYDEAISTRNVQGIILIKPVNSVNYKYNVKNTLAGLYDYLHSTTSDGKYSHGYLVKQEYSIHTHRFGLDVYNFLIEYLDAISNNDIACDIRGFYMLMDHKKLIEKYVEYLKQKRDLDTSKLELFIESLYNESRMILTKIVKCNIQSKHDFYYVIEKLNSLKKRDMEFTVCLIDFIEKNLNAFS